jgi:hypothetical protein
MVSPTPPKIFIIGGTGAQGIPIIRSLVHSAAYSVRVLTRDPASPRAQLLTSLSPHVELVRGSFTDEKALKAGFAGCAGAFVNIDGFNTGEKSEIYWAIRAYEIAVADGGIGFFVYGNLEYVSKLADFREEFRTGHYDGKGRVGEWILYQGQEAKKRLGEKAMRVALFTTGPYIEMAVAKGTLMTPTIERDGDTGEDVCTWRVPLTSEGAVAHVSLDDCGYYVRWLFDHQERADGMDLAVAIDHIPYAELAAAFARVTGRPARFIDVSFDDFWAHGPLAPRANVSAGYSADAHDPASMSVKDNFTGFWHVWRNSRKGAEQGLIKRDYKLLDEIHPGRVRSVEQFFTREDERLRTEGTSLWEAVQPEGLKPILKLFEDGFRGAV